MADRLKLATWIREGESPVFEDVEADGTKLYIKVPTAAGLVYVGYQWWSKTISSKDMAFYAFCDPQTGRVMTDDPDFPDAWNGRAECKNLIRQSLQKMASEARTDKELTAYQRTEASRLALTAFCRNSARWFDEWLGIRCERVVLTELDESINVAHAMRDMEDYASQRTRCLASTYHVWVEELGATYHEAARLYQEVMMHPEHPWWKARTIYTAAMESGASFLSITRRDGSKQTIPPQELQFQITDLLAYNDIQQVEDHGRVIYQAA